MDRGTAKPETAGGAVPLFFFVSVGSDKLFGYWFSA